MGGGSSSGQSMGEREGLLLDHAYLVLHLLDLLLQSGVRTLCSLSAGEHLNARTRAREKAWPLRARHTTAIPRQRKNASKTIPPPPEATTQRTEPPSIQPFGDTPMRPIASARHIRTDMPNDITTQSSRSVVNDALNDHAALKEGLATRSRASSRASCSPLCRDVDAAPRLPRVGEIEFPCNTPPLLLLLGLGGRNARGSRAKSPPARRPSHRLRLRARAGPAKEMSACRGRRLHLTRRRSLCPVAPRSGAPARTLPRALPSAVGRSERAKCDLWTMSQHGSPGRRAQENHAPG